MNELLLAKLGRVIQAYQKGKLSPESFGEQIDSLLASSEPDAVDFNDRVGNLVRTAKLPEPLAELVFRKLAQPSQAPARTRRLDGHSENLAGQPDRAEIKQLVGADPASDSSGGSSGDSSLSRKLLSGRKSGGHKKLQADVVIRDTYRLVSKVGKGGMGEVWKAVDLIQDAGDARDKFVAIKFLSREIRDHKYALKALVREFARYRKLIHPNLVRAYELNRDEDAVYIVMEFLSGMPLNQFIRKHPEGISLQAAKPIIQGMCEALDFAHREGVVHLDFKPGNVFYDPETAMTKVIDFGIARLSNKKERDQTLFDPGALRAKTKSYATPEMLAELDPVPSDDVFGLSCVIYELLSGKHPFNRMDAVSAEFRGLQPEPIEGLSKAQCRALEKGLAFRRENRTESVDALYRGLFPEPRQELRLPRKGFIIGLLLAFAMTIPFLYQEIGQWRMKRIVAGIEQQDFESVDTFQSMDSVHQLELLLDETTRRSLVQFYISRATPQRDALDSILELTPVVQTSLFRTPEVRAVLIEHCVSMIDQAVQQDNFTLASKIAERIASQYPDSRQLAEQSELVRKAKAQRLEELTTSFDKCLNDASRPMVDLLPCLVDSGKRMRQVDENIQALNNPQLTGRFTREIGQALSAGDLDSAAKLLGGWREMNPFESEDRTELTARWQRKNDIAELATRLALGGDAEMDDLIGELRARDPDMRLAVLGHENVRDKLLSWYQGQALAFADNNRYDAAQALLARANETFSGDQKGLDAVTELEHRIASYRTDKMKRLTERYWNALKQPDLDSETLIALNVDIRRFDPANELLEYPGLSEAYVEKIGTAIDREQFALAERLLQGWRRIRPDDSQSRTYVEIQDKMALKMRSVKERNDQIKAIQEDITAGRIDDTLVKIEALSKTFAEDDRLLIVATIKPALLKRLSEQVEIAIANRDYLSAQNLTYKVLAHFPQEEAIVALNKRIALAKSERVGELVADYRRALQAEVLKGPDLIGALASIDALDKQYLANHSELYKELGNRIKTVVGTEHPIVALQELFVRWESFLRKSEPSKEATKIYRSTRNFIALRCLFRAKVLKADGKKERADEYVMFGLSLNPSERITDSLNRELAQ
ncbi:MAG: serine/threonine-protein kinase [Gammaproteobacteria bacterium]